MRRNKGTPRLLLPTHHHPPRFHPQKPTNLHKSLPILLRSLHPHHLLTNRNHPLVTSDRRVRLVELHRCLRLWLQRAKMNLNDLPPKRSCGSRAICVWLFPCLTFPSSTLWTMTIIPLCVSKYKTKMTYLQQTSDQKGMEREWGTVRAKEELEQKKGVKVRPTWCPRMYVCVCVYVCPLSLLLSLYLSLSLSDFH